MARTQFLICCLWLLLRANYVHMQPYKGHNSNQLESLNDSPETPLYRARLQELILRIQMSPADNGPVTKKPELNLNPNQKGPQKLKYDFLWRFNYRNRFELPLPRYIEAETEVAPPETETPQTSESPPTFQTIKPKVFLFALPTVTSVQTLTGNSNSVLSMKITENKNGCIDFCP